MHLKQEPWWPLRSISEARRDLLLQVHGPASQFIKKQLNNWVKGEMGRSREVRVYCGYYRVQRFIVSANTHLENIKTNVSLFDLKLGETSPSYGISSQTTNAKIYSYFFGYLWVICVFIMETFQFRMDLDLIQIQIGQIARHDGQGFSGRMVGNRSCDHIWSKCCIFMYRCRAPWVPLSPNDIEEQRVSP